MPYNREIGKAIIAAAQTGRVEAVTEAAGSDISVIDPSELGRALRIVPIANLDVIKAILALDPDKAIPVRYLWEVLPKMVQAHGISGVNLIAGHSDSMKPTDMLEAIPSARMHSSACFDYFMNHLDSKEGEQPPISPNAPFEQVDVNALSYSDRKNTAMIIANRIAFAMGEPGIRLSELTTTHQALTWALNHRQSPDLLARIVRSHIDIAASPEHEPVPFDVDSIWRTLDQVRFVHFPAMVSACTPDDGIKLIRAALKDGKRTVGQLSEVLAPVSGTPTEHLATDLIKDKTIPYGEVPALVQKWSSEQRLLFARQLMRVHVGLVHNNQTILRRFNSEVQQ